MVLVILAVVWAIYLASWVRSRTEHRRVNSINSFSQHLSVLERTTPGSRGAGPRSASVALAGVGVAMAAPRRTTLSQAKKRRRDVLVGLLGSTGVTFLGTVALGGPVRYLFFVSLLCTVAYVVALASIQKRTLERQAKVRYLGESGAPAAWADETWAEDGDTADYRYPVGQIYAVHGR